MDCHFAEQRQAWLHLVPDPASEIFARRIFETGNLVEIVMVEPIVRRLKRGLYIGEVHDPTARRIDLAAHLQLDAKGMPMQTCTFMAHRYIRQAMRGFDRESTEDMHVGYTNGAVTVTAPLSVANFESAWRD